jgi:hypothetical protein
MHWAWRILKNQYFSLVKLLFEYTIFGHTRFSLALTPSVQALSIEITEYLLVIGNNCSLRTHFWPYPFNRCNARVPDERLSGR